MSNIKFVQKMIKKAFLKEIKNLKEDKVKFDSTFRIATTEDFKVGTTLYTSEGYGFRILNRAPGLSGIWEARGTEGQGDKVVYEDEAKFYKVKK